MSINGGRSTFFILAMFRVAHGEAYFWTKENDMREQEGPRIKL